MGKVALPNGVELKEEIMASIKKAYEEQGVPFPKNYKEAKKSIVGDGLANFIRIELEESVDWEEPMGKREAVKKCIRKLDQAKSDIEAVINALWSSVV